MRKHSIRLSGLVAGLAILLSRASCGDGTAPIDEDLCMTDPLPLSGVPNGPTITDVGLELQPGEGVIIVATATDPQGTDNLLNVLQTVGVFPDKECRGAPITLQDDLVGSGIEETFGTVVSFTADSALYVAIEAESAWPVELSFADADGNQTVGRTSARIIR